MKELSTKQMENVQGGATKEEYCKTARMIIQNNDISWEMIEYVAKICK